MSFAEKLFNVIKVQIPVGSYIFALVLFYPGSPNLCKCWDF